MIAPNALSIASARKSGMRPDEMILVSMVGRLDELNHTVFADGRDFDWTWVRDLEICIFAKPDTPWQKVAKAIAAQRPSFLAVWDVETHEGADILLLPELEDIDKPRRQWRMKLDYLPWLPFQNRSFACD
jgi:hypothetical protein